MRCSCRRASTSSRCSPRLKATPGIKALAHITGGGFPENIPRVLPDTCTAEIDLAAIAVPPVFGWLATSGNVAEAEMLRTFNCGIGMILVVAADRKDAVTAKPCGAGRGTRLARPAGAARRSACRISRAARPVRATRRRTAILISGRGSNMQALIEAARDPDFPAEIALVLSNRPEAAGLVTARDAGIAVAAVDHKIYAGREEFERSMQAMLDIHRIDLVCMAGFMRLVTPWFIGQWAGRMINVHPRPAAGIPRARHACARLGGGGQDPRLHRAFRGAGDGRRADPGAGGGAGAGRQIRPKAWHAGCWPGSTRFIPRPWPAWHAAR